MSKGNTMNDVVNVIRYIEKTCESYPAQWEGYFTDRRMFYVRYRSGKLSYAISLNDNEDDVLDWIGTNKECVSDNNVLNTESSSGEMTTTDMLKYLSFIMRLD